MLKLQSKFILRSILLLLVLSFGIFTFPAFEEQTKAVPNPIPLANPRPPQLETPDSTKPLQSSSYFMINVQSQQTLLAKDETLRRAPASTVKLLTGIVAMEKLKEEDEIQVGEEVADIDGSKLGLQPGDKIRVEELYKALYVMSANDAAIALAVAAYGSVDEFVKAMNETAKKIGATDSHFQTPNGLPYPDQYTTARDLSQIALTFIQKEELMKYVRLKEAKVEWTRANGINLSIPVKNTNQLLGIYPGDTGLKTGTTTEAGECLVTYITRPDGDILLTLLGSKDRYAETIELLDQGISMLRTQAALQNITSHPESIFTVPGFFAP